MNKLEKLTKKLLLLENEIKRRRENNRLVNYNTGKVVHQKQLAFHKCTKRNRWVLGGNRSGKTECGAVECVWIARGIHPFRENKKNVSGWVVSLSTKVQKEVAQEKILSYILPEWIEDILMIQGKKSSAKNGVIDTIFLKNVFGGTSKITFKSCEEGREKFQGASLDFVWFDEEPPEEIYTECLMRVMDKKGEIFGTMTPLKGLTFVYDKIYLNSANDDEVFCMFMEWADNPFLPESEILRMTKTMSKEELEARRFGRFVDLNSGLVYAEFSESIHVIEPFNVPHDWFDSISIDPGLNNPLSCHWYAVDSDGNIFVIAEHYQAGQNVDFHAEKIKKISRELGWHVGRSGKYEALIDSAASQRTLASTQSVVELFFDSDIAVNPHVNKDVFSGIARVKSFLKDQNGKPRLFIFKNCVNMIREIKGYFWGEGDNPRKKDDHAMDELRYFIMTKPEPNFQKPNKTIIQKDKERLIRKLKINRSKM